jgi:hypothetical protein
MQYANINTYQVTDKLPDTLVLADKTITGATLDHYLALGWRQVVAVDAPATGYVVTSYRVEDIDGRTCKLAIAASVTAASITAAQSAGEKSAAKLIAKVATEPTGRVLRAFAELVLQEINALRTKAGMTNYTQAQFLAALEAKVDAQT